MGADAKQEGKNASSDDNAILKEIQSTLRSIDQNIKSLGSKKEKNNA